MATPILEQIHKRLVEIESERYNKEVSEGKPARRKPVLKPERLGPYSLFQDFRLLEHVSEYDFILSDELFQEYCRERGVLHAAGTPGSRRWHYFVDHSKTMSEYISDPYFQFADAGDGEPYKYTDKELRDGWKVIHLGRALLQDCWELYTQYRLNDDTPCDEG